MGLRKWLSRRSGNAKPTDTVRYYDFATKTVVNIPRSKLRPGFVRAQVDDIEGIVWVSPGQYGQGPIQQPPFDDDTREYIRGIHSAFAEHRDLSFDEWEDGFRRDVNAKYEIALWSYAADVYKTFSENEPSFERRNDVYVCVVTCLGASPDTVWDVLELQAISRSEAEQIITKIYHGKDA